MTQCDKKYAVVQKTDDIIMCHGIYPYYEGIGRLIDLSNGRCKDWEANGYTLISSNAFYELEADAGYGWSWHYCDKISVEESWYLLGVF